MTEVVSAKQYGTKMNLYKYPRTPHLPWSPGRTKDDRVLSDISCFRGKKIVVTLKMDGENTTLYKEHMHARSVDSADHKSRHWMKGFWAGLRHLIPNGVRICGENLYAKHSIYYEDLESYFMAFSAWAGDTCLSYEHTRTICASLGIFHVPVICTGENFDKDFLDLIERSFSFYKGHEGYVVRNRSSFEYGEFNTNVAKFVREEHVKTDKHWIHGPLTPNKLIG